MDTIVAKRIRDLREEAGTRQEDLADYLKVERPTISQYESGKRTPDADKLTKIADYFNVSVDYLLGRTDNPISYESQRLIHKFSYKDLQPTPPERIRTFQKKIGELSEESLAFLEFQLERLRELDEEAVKRRRAERNANGNKK